MKYEVQGNNYYQGDIIKDILERRGIKDVEGYLNVSEKDVESPKNYENMQKGAEMLQKHIKNENKMHILIDTDVDGLTSASTIYLYIQDLCRLWNKEPKVTYHINEGKRHGIVLKDKDLDLNKIDLLIVPDAGSNDKDAVMECTKQGVDVLILDHHKLQRTNVLGTEAVLINHQSSPRVKNKNMAGVGVVYKFCKYIDELLDLDYADQYLDLFALGTVADLINLRSKETRYLLQKGLNNINNDFIKEIADKNSFMMGGEINPTTIGWNISPSLNATIRVGKPQERLDMFKAMIGVEKLVRYKTTKIDEKQTLQKTMARVCGNVKARQDRAVKESVKAIKDKIQSHQLDKNQILMVNVTGLLDTNYTGLVANRLASYYKRPAILLQEQKDDDKVFGGSGRNYSKHPIQDLRQYLMDTNFFDMCAGHDNAFGVKIDKQNVSPCIKYINHDLKDLEVENHYKVDYEIPMHEVSRSLVREVGEAKGLWGKGVEEPTFAITDIRIPSKEVELHGTRGKTLRFQKQGISFQKRFASEDFFNSFTKKSRKGMNVSKDLEYTIIGKLIINEHNGNKYHNVDIIDFNVEERNEILF